MRKRIAKHNRRRSVIGQRRDDMITVPLLNPDYIAANAPRVMEHLAPLLRSENFGPIEALTMVAMHLFTETKTEEQAWLNEQQMIFLFMSLFTAWKKGIFTAPVSYPYSLEATLQATNEGAGDE